MNSTRLSRPPPLRNLRAFCIAARHCSFKIAADELYLTPSAVSHQMKELEETLGVRLFERKTRALELTTAGHTLHDEVAPLLDALERSLTQFTRRHRRRNLRMTLPPFFASELFVPRLATFCTAHPDIDIQIDTSDPHPTVHPPTADVSIVLADAPPPGVNAAKLFSLKLAAVCAKELAPSVVRLGREVFRETALIVHRPRPFAWASWAEEVGLEAPEPKNIIELDSMFAVVRAAERGIGVALVPTALCGAWFATGALVRIFSIELTLSDTYYLVSRPKDAEKPEVTAVTEWALEEFGSLER
ncbi:MAG TPA: LysR substrate-binding domain-containing protein [Steroidobacteraceae bacterium]|nr:LysR substrate-binding domain-containing protein [Steroidobacteraceae bacterium]